MAILSVLLYKYFILLKNKLSIKYKKGIKIKSN